MMNSSLLISTYCPKMALSWAWSSCSFMFVSRQSYTLGNSWLVWLAVHVVLYSLWTFLWMAFLAMKWIRAKSAVANEYIDFIRGRECMKGCNHLASLK
jgi:hypothetical protein